MSASTEAVAAPIAPPSWGATFFQVSRPHILAIAALACLTFGWIFSDGRYAFLAVFLCVLDWFIVNLTNRVVDLAEDRANGIVGTELMASSGRGITWLCHGLLWGSLVAVHFVMPALTPWRVAFHLIGLAYNYKLIPTLKGRTRFKEMYAAKNLGSGVLFLISTMAYPITTLGVSPAWGTVLALIGFYLPLELTYEIAYDLRDVKGDTEGHVPTFPVVHGVPFAHRLVYALLAMSALSIVVGAAVGVLRLKETVLVLGTLQQFLYFRYRVAPEPTAKHCITLTWLGAAQIACYQVWILVGLPTQLTPTF